MNVQVVFLPRDLTPAQARGRTVVVFDVLRATTTMAAALAAGIGEIRVWGSLEAARAAADGFIGAKLLCGELNCVAPPGFDLGNSPGQWETALREKAGGGAAPVVFMSTTNGTGAIVAAAALGPANMLAGAIVNAAAVARAVAEIANDLTLLCSGTGGELSLEDILGAGAVIEELKKLGPCDFSGDGAEMARRLFVQSREDLGAALRSGAGGKNLARARLPGDVDFCARLNALDVVGEISGSPPHVRRRVASR